MSPREKDDPVYQSKQVDLPQDHYYGDEKTQQAARGHSPLVCGASILGLLAILALVARPLKFFQSVVPQQPDEDKTKSSTLLRIDDATTTTNAAVDEILLQLNASLQGRVFLATKDTPQDFAEAAFVWRQDLKPPRTIVQVATEQDVQLAVPVLAKLQTDYQIPFRIRSGGHSKAGFSTVVDGIVLSLKHLNSQSILLPEPESENPTVLAAVQPGSTVENVLDHFLQHAQEQDELYGGALGQCGNVAEGGWVLGGGVGFMARKLGLGLDNVRSFRVVLANGTLVTANQEENADLFWALRGAGQGNYGVVTSMTYQLYRLPDTQSFQKLFIPKHELGPFLYQLGALNTDGELFVVTGGKGPLVAIYMSWFSLEEDVEENIRNGNQHFEREIVPILPSSATFEPTYQSFLWAEDTHTMFDEGYGTEVYAAQVWQGFLLPANNTLQVWEAIMDLIATGMDIAPELGPHIELWGGAISDVDVTSTAFPYREAVYNVGVLLVVQDYDETARERFERQVASVNSWWPKVAEYLTGSYLNYPMNSLRAEEYARLYWGEHLEQLVEIKQRYDPGNSFVFEQSMPAEL